jgi:cytoskeletal protein CcmA (bactofilin family)
LSKAAGKNSSEPDPDLLNETNQSFQDWLEDLSVPPTVESTQRNSSVYSPKASREINFEGTLTVEGYLAGIISAPEGTLVLGEKGEIDGDIFVNVAIIYGSVRGDIHATTKVELRHAGKVIGDIETLELAIQPGAVFEGRCVFPHPAADDQPDVSLAAAN